MGTRQADGQGADITLGADIVVEPLGGKGPGIQPVLEAVDNQGLAADKNMEGDELLKGSDALFIDLVDRDAVDVGKVGRRLDQGVDVEVGRNRLKGRARALGGHERSMRVCSQSRALGRRPSCTYAYATLPLSSEEQMQATNTATRRGDASSGT